jgi:hypothetical protein
MVETVKKYVEIVRALPLYQKLLEILREKGIDVEPIIKHLIGIFYLPRP